MMRLLKLCLYFFCGILFFHISLIPAQVPDVQAVTTEQEATVLDLVTRFRQSTVLSADIEQITIDQDGRELQERTAKLVLEKPDHLYWEVIAPYSELTVINGEKVWFFEPDLDQVTIQDFSDDLSRTPMLLLNGDAEAIKRNYTVSSSELADGQYTSFILLPRDPGNLVELLSLTFADNTLTEMHLEDSSGQKTSLLFSNVLSEIELDGDIFEFVIPEGIEVIDNSGQ